MSAYDKPMIGYKGGGESKPRTPRESPDSLVSISYARIVDLLSEGEIFGLVDGANSIYLNETPATSFSGFRYDSRNGAQDQTYMQGFPAVENEVTVSVELRSDLPYQRAVTDLKISALRVTISVPSLLQQNPSNGDTTGYRVDYAIDVKQGAGAFVEVKTASFIGKTTNGYERSERVDLPGNPVGGWTVRVRRLTANSTTATIQDTTNIKSVTEIIDAKFRYPNSAVIGMSFDAETFGNSVPKRGYHIRGRIISVPSNYNPVTRTYSGVWDGTFQQAYSNNPAWVYYDLLLNPRFGLGDRITAAQVDKWSLYQIGQYCDQLVDDGKGGQEPRYTCNLYLQKRTDALKVLQDIAGIFRGITYWGAGQAMISADMPSDPVYTYTNANIIGGKFAYKGSKRSTRYSVALVSWNDPADMYRAKVEYIQDDALVARLGVREISLTAIGCTSQGQAQRAGRWALLTNQLETETVNFTVGLDGVRARPGQIVRVADGARAGKRIGGRIRSATASVLQLDTPVTWAKPGYAGSTIDFAGYTLNYAGSGVGNNGISIGDQLTAIMPSGVAETRTVSAVTWDNIATVSPAFSDTPIPMSIWALETPALLTQLFRVTSISEGGPLEYTISATKHVADKYAAADFGTIVSDRPVTAIPISIQGVVTNLQAVTDWQINQAAAVTNLTIRWDAPPGAVRYDVEWSRNESDWVYAGNVTTTQVVVQGVYAGSYRVRVKAINALGITSVWQNAGPFELQGKSGLPPAPVGLATTGIVFGIRVNWGIPVGAEDTAYTELQMADSNLGAGLVGLGLFAAPTTTYTHSGMAAGVQKFFRARLIDKTGNVGPWTSWVVGQSSAQADEILDYLTGQITDTQLGQSLLSEIDQIGVNTTEIQNEATVRASADSALASQITTVQATANGASVTAQQALTTSNSTATGLAAMYSVKLQVNNNGQYVMAGIGLGIENVEGTLQSQFLVRADRFAILNNNDNGTVSSPFIVQGGQTIINSAIIGNASISWLKIGDDVQSSNYVAGVSGWRLRKDGNFEINGSVPGQGRMKIDNQTVEVFDAAGVRRVRLGIWE